jgi:mannose-6-phosphate isomerase
MTSSASRALPIERVERPWGWFETVSEPLRSKVKRIHLEPGQRISLQKHHQRAEHWVVVEGLASITIGERQFDLQPGESCDIARGQVHRLANRTDEALEIIEVQFGDHLAEDDIVRIEDDYERD